MERVFQTLEYTNILTELAELACTKQAKKRIFELKPYLDEREVKNRLHDTLEARKALDSLGTPPISAMSELEHILLAVEKNDMLLPVQLEEVNRFLASVSRLSRYLHRCKGINITLGYYEDSMVELPQLREEIERSIRNEQVDDYASDYLKNIRRDIEQTNTQIRVKLEGILRSQSVCFSDSFVSNRNGHFVLPVKKEYKSRIEGSVIDTSSTGNTLFIEPASISKLMSELSLLEIQQENEVRRILYTLTAMVYENMEALKVNMDIMESLDFIFAKGKLSAQMKGISPTINSERRILIEKGRHPLLDSNQCIPLDFRMEEGLQGIIITGPNTGGKTVTLKTIGLFSLMAQSGLHIPCEAADICMNSQVLCDIGDGQSISENLSTFSSHIKNVIDIINKVDSDSLVLLDELGSGTDPAEGMGIAIAILEELRQNQCLFIATTHYPEVKNYGERTDGILNARMAFDRETMKPLYRLELGEAGESCALFIAKRLGMPSRMLQRAYHATYGEGHDTKVQSNHSNEQVKSEEIFDIQDTKEEVKPRKTTSKIKRDLPPKQVSKRALEFQIGDSVLVYPQKKIGIVYQQANDKGEIGVQIHKNKQLINHKRLQLKAAAKDLYPPDYDFSIIFDTVENRKASKKMSKGHQEGLIIERADY